MSMGVDIAGIPFILFLWLLLPVRAWSRLSYSALLVAVLVNDKHSLVVMAVC